LIARLNQNNVQEKITLNFLYTVLVLFSHKYGNQTVNRLTQERRFQKNLQSNHINFCIRTMELIETKP